MNDSAETLGADDHLEEEERGSGQLEQECTVFLASIEAIRYGIIEIETGFCTRLYPALRDELARVRRRAQREEQAYAKGRAEWEQKRQAFVQQAEQLRINYEVERSRLVEECRSAREATELERKDLVMARDAEIFQREEVHQVLTAKILHLQAEAEAERGQLIEALENERKSSQTAQKENHNVRKLYNELEKRYRALLQQCVVEAKLVGSSKGKQKASQRVVNGNEGEDGPWLMKKQKTGFLERSLRQAHVDGMFTRAKDKEVMATGAGGGAENILTREGKGGGEVIAQPDSSPGSMLQPEGRTASRQRDGGQEPVWYRVATGMSYGRQTGVEATEQQLVTLLPGTSGREHRGRGHDTETRGGANGSAELIACKADWQDLIEVRKSGENSGQEKEEGVWPGAGGTECNIDLTTDAARIRNDSCSSCREPATVCREGISVATAVDCKPAAVDWHQENRDGTCALGAATLEPLVAAADPERGGEVPRQLANELEHRHRAGGAEPRACRPVSSETTAVLDTMHPVPDAVPPRGSPSKPLTCEPKQVRHSPAVEDGSGGEFVNVEKYKGSSRGKAVRLESPMESSLFKVPVSRKLRSAGSHGGEERPWRTTRVSRGEEAADEADPHDDFLATPREMAVAAMAARQAQGQLSSQDTAMAVHDPSNPMNEIEPPSGTSQLAQEEEEEVHVDPLLKGGPVSEQPCETVRKSPSKVKPSVLSTSCSRKRTDPHSPAELAQVKGTSVRAHEDRPVSRLISQLVVRPEPSKTPSDATGMQTSTVLVRLERISEAAAGLELSGGLMPKVQPQRPAAERKDVEADSQREEQASGVPTVRTEGQQALATTSKKAPIPPIPAYKYNEPVRKKADREALQGVECKTCKQFYDAVLAEDAEGIMDNRCEHHQAASRHRYKYAPPATPDGFWNIGFDTE